MYTKFFVILFLRACKVSTRNTQNISIKCGVSIVYEIIKFPKTIQVLNYTTMFADPKERKKKGLPVKTMPAFRFVHKVKLHRMLNNM